MPRAPHGIWYDVDGHGPPIVLLHAGVVDSRIWAPVLPLLGRRHRVVVYDQRGYGRSDPWNGRYSVVEDLTGVLDTIGLGSAALVGLSRGGMIALATALERPERVAALVLVASGLGGHPLEVEATPEQESRWATAEEIRDLNALAELDMEIWAPLGVDAELRRMFVENAEASNGDDPAVPLDPPEAERLGDVAAPTLVVTAGRDVPAIAQVGSLLVRGIPGATGAVIAEADHMVPWRAPEDLARLVLDFVAAQATASPA